VLAIGSVEARAESGVPDPTTFFAGLVNPSAKGKKVSGSLTIAYDLVESDDPDACSSVVINNMFVVTTLRYRKVLKPFNRDFVAADGTTYETPFCFDSLQRQIDFVMALIREEAIPFFFMCGPNSPLSAPPVLCPSFEVKSLKNFLSSGTGAVSTEVGLVVRAPGPRDPEDDD